MALTQRAHELIQIHFANKPKGTAVDATCGNGHDTEFLCRLEFEHVIGFDIQAQAIETSTKRIEQAQLNAQLIKSGHENIEQYITGEIDCVMFNFGYLPKADKSLTTKSSTSIKALTTSLNKLSKTGLISLMCYPGHAEGAIETEKIKQQLDSLGCDWQVENHLAKSPKPTAPTLYIITRSKK